MADDAGDRYRRDDRSVGGLCPDPGDDLAEDAEVAVGLLRVGAARDLAQLRNDDDVPPAGELSRKVLPLLVVVRLAAHSVDEHDEGIPAAFLLESRCGERRPLQAREEDAAAVAPEDR